MAAIRGKDTQPELAVRRVLFAAGFRYRLNSLRLPGRPDIVLPRYRRVVFVHGCFWHRHGCPRSFTPRSNAAYWAEKFAANLERDRRIQQQLEAAGWRVTTIWTCDLVHETELLVEALRREREQAT